MNCIKMVVPMNPCKCGYFPDRNRCNCSLADINRHFGRISTPFMDRIDMGIQVEKASFDELTESSVEADTVYTSANMRKIVKRTWKRQYERLGFGRYNSYMNGKELEEFCRTGEEARALLRKAYERYDLSARAYHKLLKVARTIADMEEKEEIEVPQLLEALGYRLKYGQEEG